MDKKAVGALVHETWKASGIPQKEVLSRMGITRAHFNNICRGVYSPAVQFLTDLTAAIGGHLILDIELPARPRVTLVVHPAVAEMVQSLETNLPAEARDALTAIVRDEKASRMLSDLVLALAAGLRPQRSETGEQVSP